jgi:hypothetical protein
MNFVFIPKDIFLILFDKILTLSNIFYMLYKIYVFAMDEIIAFIYGFGASIEKI